MYYNLWNFTFSSKKSGKGKKQKRKEFNSRTIPPEIANRIEQEQRRTSHRWAREADQGLKHRDSFMTNLQKEFSRMFNGYDK